MMTLTEKEMAIVQDILLATIPEYEVYAFGSRVHGRGLKSFSDIDLAIISTRPMATDVWCELEEQFAESDLPYKVDLVDYAAASQKFRDIIQLEYEVVYKPQEDASNND